MIDFRFSFLSYCIQVIHNKNITKTQKVRFFTGQLLNHIAALYNWNGVSDIVPENPESTEVSPGFLLALFLYDLTVRISKLLCPASDL